MMITMVKLETSCQYCAYLGEGPARLILSSLLRCRVLSPLLSFEALNGEHLPDAHHLCAACGSPAGMQNLIMDMHAH